MILIITILSVHILLITLEIIYDTLVHKSKTSTDQTKRKRYAQEYHILQLIIYSVITVYVIYLTLNMYYIWLSQDYWEFIYKFFIIVVNYAATRVWVFNKLYNIINDLSNTYLSPTELYDVWENRLIKWIIKRTSGRSINILYTLLNTVKITLYFFSIVYLFINLYD